MDEFWMNPRKPMGAQWQGNAGFLGEREQTRERVEPWNIPWQGNADFVTDIPGNAGVDSLRRENMMIPPPMRDRYPAELDPATGQMRLQQYLGREEPIPQTQRPARPVVPFPEGESLNRTPIANSFMDKIKSMFGRSMEAPAFNMESIMVPFEDEEYFGAGSMHRSQPPGSPVY